jgi:glycosyltransferase involved in cell wall biosynthesis
MKPSPPDPLSQPSALPSGIGGALRIAAAIPAYQAAPSVGDVVRGALELLPEVLVVDDGSTDGTAEAARRAGARVI